MILGGRSKVLSSLQREAQGKNPVSVKNRKYASLPIVLCSTWNKRIEMIGLSISGWLITSRDGQHVLHAFSCFTSICCIGYLHRIGRIICTTCFQRMVLVTYQSCKIFFDLNPVIFIYARSTIIDDRWRENFEYFNRRELWFLVKNVEKSVYGRQNVRKLLTYFSEAHFLKLNL